MSKLFKQEPTESKVYVGDLPRDADEKEIERAFEHYGTLKSVWVARNPPGFGFIQYEDPRDAQDAVRGLDGSSLCGVRIRVEHATGKTKPKNFNRGGGMGGGRVGMDRRVEPFPYRPSSPPRRADNMDRCYICGDYGHASYDCPRSSNGRNGSSRDRGRDNYGRHGYNDRRENGAERSRYRSPPSPWARPRNRSRSYSRSPVRSGRRSRSD